MEKEQFEKLASGIYDKWVLNHEGRLYMTRDLFTLSLYEFWNTHVIALSDEKERCLEALRKLADYNNNLESDNKLLRGENKHLISKYVNLDEINVTTYASHTKEELIKELNYYQNVVCAAKDNTNRMLLEEIERLKEQIESRNDTIRGW